MIRIFIAMVALVVGVTSTASATNFAILLGGKPSEDDSALVVKNPLYQGSGNGGQNPLYEPQSLIFDPNQLWQGAPAEFSVTMDVDLPRDLPPAPAGAFVFGLFLTDAGTGDAIHQLAQPVLVTTDAGGPIVGDFTFGSFDPDSGAWTEISKATKKDENYLCGVTNHFSYFYIAPVSVPEPSACVLAALAGLGGCIYGWRKRRE